MPRDSRIDDAGVATFLCDRIPVANTTSFDLDQDLAGVGFRYLPGDQLKVSPG
jgi:hypothetical protein